MAGKRARTEEQSLLEDSMQSLIMEFKGKSDYTVNEIGRFMCEYLEKSEEFRRSCYDIQHEISEVQGRVKVIEEKMEVRDKNDRKNNEKIEAVESDVKEIEAKANRVEQKQVEKHVFLSGFPVKPKKEEIIEKLFTIYDVPTDSIDFSYGFEFKTRPKASSTIAPGSSESNDKINFQMVIAFKDHQGKEKFMKTKREKGPVMFEQLTTAKLSANERKCAIRIVNRLSKFNLKAQRHLQVAKMNQKIFSYQLHNGLFRLKVREDSGWTIIDNNEALEPYVEKKKKPT
jgi:hypothetical protein